MARKWTAEENDRRRKKLTALYLTKNLSLKKVAQCLGMTESGVFSQLKRLDIQTVPEKKAGYLNTKKDITIPVERTPDLAELFGVLLGDGHVSHFQTMVTLGSKEASYVAYVAKLFQRVTGVRGTICKVAGAYYTVYVGSVTLTEWLFKEGMVSNKVREQVDVPKWIFESPIFMERFVRGFFDTDGSVYRLKFGIQVSFCNRSVPLLKSIRNMLVLLEYRVSEISLYNLYMTRRSDVARFFREISPKNIKHIKRYRLFKKDASISKRSTDARCKRVGFQPS
jgi:hypothetical protein